MRYIYHVFAALFVLFNVSQAFNGMFWHICDIHLNSSYSNSHKNIEHYGNYFGDSPLPLVQSAISAMKSKSDNPDFIIWNGDNGAHMDMENTIFLDTIQNVTDELKAKFPNTIILPSLGNHDVNPKNQIGENSNWCELLLKPWAIFLNSTEAKNTFKKGCYYSRIIRKYKNVIKIIVLNTILWYSENLANKNVVDPSGQFAWMKKELQQARDSGLKVFIVGHVPPGAAEYTPDKYRHFHPEFNAEIVDILRVYSDVIEAGFFSHQHTDSFKIVYNSTGSPVIPLFLSPSVTPLHLSRLGSVNPSIRLYRWSNTPSSRSYEQYHTTLPRTTPLGSVLNWTLEYESKSMLPSLSASDMHALLRNFTLPKSQLFTEFFRRHLSGRSHDENETCPFNSMCRCKIICGMRHIVLGELTKCLDHCPSTSIFNVTEDSVTRPPSRISQVPMIVSVIVVFTLILIATVVGVNKVYCHQRRSASLTRDIYMATYNGKNCEEIVEDHIDHIAEKTFGDVPEYRGHMRNNSRTILTLNDGNEIVEVKSQPSISKFAISKKEKPQEKYDYSRM